MTTLLAIALLTFIDGLVVVGLVINGWGAFAACLYAHKVLETSIIWITAASFCGVFCGEQFSFYLTVKYGTRILDVTEAVITKIVALKKGKLGALMPGIDLDRWRAWRLNTAKKDARWMGASLILGRWTPLASLMPTVACLNGMKYRKFLLISAASCLLWSSIWNSVVWMIVKGYVSSFSP